VVAGARHVGALEQAVDLAADALDGGVETVELLPDVLGDERSHDDSRFVQHDVAEPDRIRQPDPGKLVRPARGQHDAGLGDRLQLARRDHLGEHERDRLEGLDLLLRVEAVRLVLHDEHAERVAGAQDGHADEGVEHLLAELDEQLERRVSLRVGERERLRLLGDGADEPFADAHLHHVHLRAVQPLGGVELELAVGARHVHGADLRDHVRGDQNDDLVEPLLRADRLRHHLAETAQQHARPAEGGPHRPAHRTGAGAPNERNAAGVAAGTSSRPL
jgi:hypothetical protein